MREAGAEVEVFYTKTLDIKPCQGELNCQFKTPGRCFQKDNMEMLLPKLAEADIHVYASPVYVDGITGPLKNLWDRMIPSTHLSFELRDGHCRHPLRQGRDASKTVLVSTCGFWEMDNFDPLLVHIRAQCRNANRQFRRALLRPHAPALDTDGVRRRTGQRRLRGRKGGRAPTDRERRDVERDAGYSQSSAHVAGSVHAEGEPEIPAGTRRHGDRAIAEGQKTARRLS